MKTMKHISMQAVEVFSCIILILIDLWNTTPNISNYIYLHLWERRHFSRKLLHTCTWRQLRSHPLEPWKKGWFNLANSKWVHSNLEGRVGSTSNEQYYSKMKKEYRMPLVVEVFENLFANVIWLLKTQKISAIIFIVLSLRFGVFYKLELVLFTH